jgi:hypothetical protein
LREYLNDLNDSKAEQLRDFLNQYQQATITRLSDYGQRIGEELKGLIEKNSRMSKPISVESFHVKSTGFYRSGNMPRSANV